MTKIKIIGNRNSSKLEDLAKQAGDDDAELIRDILNLKSENKLSDQTDNQKDKRINPTTSSKNKASIRGDFLFYAVHNPENVATWSQIINKKHKSILFKKDLNASGMSEVFAVSDFKVTALEYVQDYGLVWAVKCPEGNSISRLSNVDLKTLSRGSKEHKDSNLGKSNRKVNSLVSIPNFALISACSPSDLLRVNLSLEGWVDIFSLITQSPSRICYLPKEGLFGVEQKGEGCYCLVRYLNKNNDIDRETLRDNILIGNLSFISSYQEDKILLGLDNDFYSYSILDDELSKINLFDCGDCAIFMNELNKFAVSNIAGTYKRTINMYNSDLFRESKLDDVDGKITAMKYVRL
ncbi:hypothetical protein HOK51_07570 [Candidatus Woesearchaeota archaeon]|jgi:hypothetical protein|nr:hypothetical protein [Candidatus Woesearchaeota archaeon]MBT6519682.1 hypothetical protein [Candidatus Woesearchaeota archaeon]MBT7367373.1 hypothetical protein [Candidatus Woesearchaeota archaeon]